MSRFDESLQRGEAELENARDIAAWDLRTDFSAALRRHRLHRHKITIENVHGCSEVCIDGQRWWEGRLARHSERFSITTLLNDIADTIQKCDNGVLRHLYGVTL